MKTSRKVVLIVATVLLVGGSALAGGSFALADFSFENLSNTTRDWTSATKTLAPEAEAPHTAIVVRDDASAESVRFEPTDGDAIEVEYWTSPEKDMAITEADGVLEIVGEATPLASIQFMKMDFQDRTTVVKVPRGWTGSITAETSSGNIALLDLAGIDSASITTQSGVATINGMQASGVVSARSTNGRVDVQEVAANSVSAVSASGSVNVVYAEADAVEAKSTSGRVQTLFVTAKTMRLASTSGSVQATCLAADDIAIETKSGSVDATVAANEEDYVVEGSTTSGSLHLPAGTTDGDKRIRVITTSGNATLSFVIGGEAYENPAHIESDSPFSAPTAPEAPEAPAAP